MLCPATSLAFLRRLADETFGMKHIDLKQFSSEMLLRLLVGRTRLVEDYEIPIAMVAHEVGMTAAAISKRIKAFRLEVKNKS